MSTYEYVLKCDTCGFVAKSWPEADAHEDALLDHWVQSNLERVGE